MESPRPILQWPTAPEQADGVESVEPLPGDPRVVTMSSVTGSD